MTLSFPRLLALASERLSQISGLARHAPNEPAQEACTSASLHQEVATLRERLRIEKMRLSYTTRDDVGQLLAQAEEHLRNFEKTAMVVYRDAAIDVLKRAAAQLRGLNR